MRVRARTTCERGGWAGQRFVGTHSAEFLRTRQRLLHEWLSQVVARCFAAAVHDGAVCEPPEGERDRSVVRLPSLHSHSIDRTSDALRSSMSISSAHSISALSPVAGACASLTNFLVAEANAVPPSPSADGAASPAAHVK